MKVREMRELWGKQLNDISSGVYDNFDVIIQVDGKENVK